MLKETTIHILIYPLFSLIFMGQFQEAVGPLVSSKKRHWKSSFPNLGGEIGVPCSTSQYCTLW